MISNTLLPLTTIYGVGVAVRNALFDAKILRSYKSSLPVVCVGNITIGGNGKTPFSLFLLHRLVQLGLRPVLLSRGYGGSLRGPVCVNLSHTAEEVGDEAILYRNEFPDLSVVIASDRVNGAKYVESAKLGDCIVLDDGYQHRYLERDLNLILIDSKTPGLTEGVVKESLIPAGRLREPARKALQRADGVVFVRKDISAVSFPALYGMDNPAWDFYLRPNRLIDLYSGKDVPRELLLNKEVVAVAAIANPESFLDSLRQLGIVPNRTFFFRDHHNYTEKDWFDIKATTSAMIITTAKDGVKLRRFLTAEDQLIELQLSGDLQQGTNPEFDNWLKGKIERA